MANAENKPVTILIAGLIPPKPKTVDPTLAICSIVPPTASQMLNTTNKIKAVIAKPAKIAMMVTILIS